MINTKLAFMISILLVLTLSACSSKTEPRYSELEKALSVELPAYLNLHSFSIEASENMGTNVEPLYQTRFKAILKLNTDTFIVDKKEGNITFVTHLLKSGKKIEVFGKSISRLYAGKWQTDLSLDGSPIQSLGKPLSMFSASRVIVRGSKEEKDYFAEQRRIAEEKRQAEEIIEKKWRKTLKKAPTLIVGSWRNEVGVVTFLKNGNILYTMNSGEKTQGTWNIDGDTLTINHPPPNASPGIRLYKILEISTSKYKIVGISGDCKNNVYNARRIK